MDALWQKYLNWFAARLPRERLIVAVATIGGLLFLGFSYGIEPALARIRQAQQPLATLPAETAALEQLVKEVTEQGQDPDAAMRAELARISADYAEQSQRFRIVERSLIAPAEMTALLESLLKRSRGLELLSLRSAKPVPLLGTEPSKVEPKAGETAGAPSVAPAATPPVVVQELPGGQLYKHGIELRIAGNYLDLLHYLQTLETEAPGLLWGRIDLKLEHYPRSIMTLTIHTLSLDTSWLLL